MRTLIRTVKFKPYVIFEWVENICTQTHTHTKAMAVTLSSVFFWKILSNPLTTLGISILQLNDNV